MKAKKFIIIAIIISIVICLLFSCTTFKQAAIVTTNDYEVFCCTWIVKSQIIINNEEITGKIIFNTDGTYHISETSVYTEINGKLTIRDKWEDTKGNKWYRITGIQDKFMDLEGNIHNQEVTFSGVYKLDKSGKTIEVYYPDFRYNNQQDSLEIIQPPKSMSFPDGTEWDTREPYAIYYHQ
jgi:hypothetical protein